MYKLVFRILAILVVAIVVQATPASEPDGRMVFRYAWVEDKSGAATAPKLRLMVTALVAVSDAELSATLPAGIGLTVSAEGLAASRLPEEGLALGDVAAGQTVVVEFDIEKKAHGDGVIGFAFRGTADGRPVREGVGVPVGVPGAKPTLRNGAAEFPAARADPAP